MYSIMECENSTSSEPKTFGLPSISSSFRMDVDHHFLQHKYEWHFMLLKVFVSSEMHFSFVTLIGKHFCLMLWYDVRNQCEGKKGAEIQSDTGLILPLHERRKENDVAVSRH